MWYFSRKDGRTWRQLMVIVNQLPTTSKFIIAQRNDPDVAAYVVNKTEGLGEERPWTPLPAEWGQGAELLASLFDRLGELITVTINANAKSPTQPPAPYPRPVTEVDKARSRIEAKIEDELADLITGAHKTWDETHPYN